MKVSRLVGMKKSKHDDYCSSCGVEISVIDRVLHNSLCYRCWCKDLDEED